MSGDLARKQVTPFWKQGQLAKPKTAVKRAFRARAGKQRWEQIRKAKMGPCRVCVWAIQHSDTDLLALRDPSKTTLHHVLSKSLGGDDRNDNCIPLCGDGTNGHHGAVEAHHRCSCHAVALTLTEAECAYVTTKGGEGFIERRYHVVYETIGRMA